MPQKMPVLFVSHGSPMTIYDRASAEEYASWSAKLPQPKALLVFSAHWEADQLEFGETVAHEQLIYDFYGFPESLYELQYPAPGANFLVEQIDNLLQVDIPRTSRGLDHGVWVPLLHMYPKADIPILQMSIPRFATNDMLLDLGKQLSALRENGIAIVGAGTLTHNLREGLSQKYKTTPDWAIEFDQWVGNALLNDKRQLLDWENHAPFAQLNHPTKEHFKPLLIALGAARADDLITFPILGFDFQVFSKRSVQFG